MNSAVLTAGAIVLLALGYYFYGRFIERQCIQPDKDRQTPAFALRDGVDYEPARPLMLFGHYFTTIAALLYQTWGFLLGKSPNVVLGVICLVLAGLAIYVAAEALPRLRRARAPRAARP